MPQNIDQLIEILKIEGIRDKAVLNAMRKIPRHIFVPEAYQFEAYENIALPFRDGQTISQPYIVAKMTEALKQSGSMYKVLEIGTGSGYQTAILAQLAKRVYTIERIESLCSIAQQHLKSLDIKNVAFRHADGIFGWSEHAPFDAIIVTAAALESPKSLLMQIKIGGRMIIPIGVQGYSQILSLITRRQEGFVTQNLEPVIFVPLMAGIQK